MLKPLRSKSHGRLLKHELGKALKVGRHAFVSGYVHGVRQSRNLPHDKKAAERFSRERYKGLDNIHSLALNGFTSRIGHYNHWARRNDWRAVAKDIANLNIGARSADNLIGIFGDIKHLLRDRATVTFEDNVGKVHWPDSLRSTFVGVIPHIAEVLADKNGLHITARKKRGMVLLDYSCANKTLTTEDYKTLALSREIVQYFGGNFIMAVENNKLNVSINLPYKIRVDTLYGGYRKKSPNK